MPYNQTVQTTFNKGLLTEFSELNFPTEASVDELNCNLYKAGNRSKRLGVEIESQNVPTTENYAPNLLMHTEAWENVGEDANLEYLVVQTGNKLRFYQKGVMPLSDGIVKDENDNDYILDMSQFEVQGGLGAGASRVDCASINGLLVVASPQIDTFYIKKNPNGSFSTTQIEFKIRDYEWLGFPKFYYEEISPSNVTDGRRYDTLNCGWGLYKTTNNYEAPSYFAAQNQALKDYRDARDNFFPPLTHPWYSGKDASGDFSVSEFRKIDAGSSLTANGHFILDLYDQDRERLCDISGLEDTSPSGRFSTVAAYSGRVFYAGMDSKVYFSQLLESERQIGSLLQRNDPTAEYLSDLLDTDGGWVSIPEAAGINKLHVFGPSLLVFAKNGVWKISGVDDVFRATEYSVSKITDFGLSVKNSFAVGSNNLPFWWSYTGIHSIVVSDTGGFQEVNLTKTTIQSFWNDIPEESKSFVFSAYDGTNNKVAWFYPNAEESLSYKVSNVLWFDVDLQAFYPWKVSDAEDNRHIVGASFFRGSGANDITFDVVDGNGNLVYNSSGDQVVVTRTAGVIFSSEIKLLVKNDDGSLSFAGFTGIDFLDWNESNYEAYAEAAYNFKGDMTRRKTQPYITVLMKQTELGWITDGAGFTPVRPSSLKVSAYWDFKDTPSTSPQEAYRFKFPLIVDPDNLDVFDYPSSVITTKLRLRGRGRVVKLRFEGEEGKDFNLLGYETIDYVPERF